MSDHRTIEWAIDIIRMCEPIRCHQGGMWFGRNHNFADATFVDYGAADAFAVAVKALPRLVKALEGIARQHIGDEIESENPDFEGAYEAIIKIARAALDAVSSPPERGNG